MKLSDKNFDTLMIKLGLDKLLRGEDRGENTKKDTEVYNKLIEILTKMNLMLNNEGRIVDQKGKIVAKGPSYDPNGYAIARLNGGTTV